MEKVRFDLTGMAWNRESQFGLDWNGLEWRQLIFEESYDV
jgi:hypothetical protein